MFTYMKTHEDIRHSCGFFPYTWQPIGWYGILLQRHWSKQTSKPRWWFQIYFTFIPIWGRFPFWLICLRWVETTNQKPMPPPFEGTFGATNSKKLRHFTVFFKVSLGPKFAMDRPKKEKTPTNWTGWWIHFFKNVCPYLGRWSNFTHIFVKWVETTN